MKQIYIRLIRLLFGLFLFALGIVATMNANIGYAPWDVLHAGIAGTIGWNIGTVSIIVGIFIGLLTILLGEKIGLGTLLNMVLIGVFIDMLIALKIIPFAGSFFTGIPMMVLGLFIIALGSYFYIASGFGAGPRDSLMVALTRLTRIPIGICRGSIELAAVLAGWLLGGPVGLGTILSAFAIGLCVQITFRVLKFDATQVKHETLQATLQRLMPGKKDGTVNPPEDMEQSAG